MKEQLKQMSTADLKAYLDLLNESIGAFIDGDTFIDGKSTAKQEADFYKSVDVREVILKELNDRLNIFISNVNGYEKS